MNLERIEIMDNFASMDAHSSFDFSDRESEVYSSPFELKWRGS